MGKEIIIQGARANNLKSINLAIPRNKLVVVTGLSGSGKSSLAFDTLFAEGQRRYVESLSAYARQFLGRMPKPECDFIRGLPPAIAIEQKTISRNSRSTVGTSTEIYDFLRLLFARVGKTYSPISGELVKKHTADDVLQVINSYPIGTRFAILAPIIIPKERDFAMQLHALTLEGFSRLESNGNFINITSIDGNDVNPDDYKLLIDRMTVTRTKVDEMRLLDSLATAFYEGNDECSIKVWDESGDIIEHTFSKRFEADGMTFEEPSELMFNFNNPLGACPKCEGFGNVVGIDENLVIPNKTLSVYQDAVMCWRGQVMNDWKQAFTHYAGSVGFPIHRPYYQLTQEQKDLLWHGDSNFGGIDEFFNFIQNKSYNIQYRVLLARYRGKTTCPECHGSRLKKEASYVKVGDKTISQLANMPINELQQWFKDLKLSEHDATIAKRLLTEINSRIDFLINVGLEYLTLDRLSSTLSGGESQRINLASSLGSSLVGSLYILDEPSIGLHSRDTHKLIDVLKKLRNLGNTVLVVEHDEDIIKNADFLIDIGPQAGRNGGNVVFSGTPQEMSNASIDNSYTLKYLNHTLNINVPKIRHRWNNFIEIKGAAQNNLKGIDVKFPLGVMTVVTGVSGSGKSTLVNSILHKALARHFGDSCDAPGTHSALTGDLNLINGVELIDQTPIGKSSRSNPATYLKAFDEIRQLFASQQLSKQMGYNAGFFSFNTVGGRCEECKGEGTITIEMQFMADITITCDACHGKRFSRNALDVVYQGKNVYDVLDMTINQAIEFFGSYNTANERRIVAKLKPLQEVGLGYIKLGQSSSTLSGGENQRVKLAYHLAGDKRNNTVFIFDEPTTGLHFHDINTLLKAFNRLIENGHTVIIIEHNLDVIKCADHIIDLGPEGGNNGGNIVVQGTPEEVANCKNSYTGKFLKEKLLEQG